MIHGQKGKTEVTWFELRRGHIQIQHRRPSFLWLYGPNKIRAMKTEAVWTFLLTRKVNYKRLKFLDLSVWGKLWSVLPRCQEIHM